jgi:hypothetical protein
MKIRPGKDSFKANHFPSPSDPPTITQTTSQAQPRVYLRCETETRVLRRDTEFGVPILWPFTHAGYELVGAGMLAAGRYGKPLDNEALERWTRVSYERGRRSRRGER